MSKDKESSVDFEIKFYEGILKRKPNFIEALMAIGDLYTQKGYYEKGLEVDKKLAVLRPDNSTIHYNLACSYSLINEIDQSFKAMQRALECGYDDLAYLEEDDDLINLRKDSRFQQLLAMVKSQNPTPPKKRLNG